MDLLDRVAQPLRLVEGLSRLDALQALDGYQDEIVDVVRGLLQADDVDVLAVTQVIAHVNDSLTRRLLALGEAELGPPPAAYAWLALGSHGRGEQVLSSDQDSALAYADPPGTPPLGAHLSGTSSSGSHSSGSHSSGTVPPSGSAPGDDPAAGPVPAYFRLLAEQVVGGLERAGLPLCDGGYMATNWCRPVSEYWTMFHSWVERPEPDSLIRAEVFLDVRPVHGALPVDVLDRTLLAGASRGPFRAQLARAAVTFRPPIGFFGRLRTPEGHLDVKRAGTAAIVLLARLYALAGGSSARTTLLRLDAAAQAHTLSRPGAADLAEAYRLLTGLRLRHQVEQVTAGSAPDNLVPLDDLPAGAHDRLRRTLRHLRDVQEATASRFNTHTVT